MLARRRRRSNSTPDRASAARRASGCASSTRAVQAGRRADPLRRRAGRRGRPISSASCPAAASGSPRRGDASREAVARKAFARGFKRDVRVTPDLAGADRAAARARRARCAGDRRQGRRWSSAGFAKVEAALARETVAGLLHAAEAGADGVAQARRGAAPAAATTPSKSPVDHGISRPAQLDLALGRSNVVHAALLAGPASDTFLARCCAP